MSHAMEAVLFEHSRRPEWGLALITHDGDDRRIYLFQDGRERTFKEGFFHLMVPADKPADVLAQVLESLQTRIGRPAGGRSGSDRHAGAISFETQVAIFKVLYPDGFQGDTYTVEHRGTEDGRRLKRHLDPALTSARRLLSLPALQRLMGEEDYETIHARAVEVITGTELVPAPERRGISNLPPERRPEFGSSLLDLLHGEGPYYDRMTRWLTTLTHPDCDRVKWSMATALPALVHPDEHVCIKPGPFAKAAGWHTPPVTVGQVPDASIYERVQTMIKGLKVKLEGVGLKPRDLLDVRTFLVIALKPKNLKLVE